MKDITSIVRVGDQFKLKFARQGFSIGSKAHKYGKKILKTMNAIYAKGK